MHALPRVTGHADNGVLSGTITSQPPSLFVRQNPEEFAEFHPDEKKVSAVGTLELFLRTQNQLPEVSVIDGL